MEYTRPRDPARAIFLTAAVVSVPSSKFPCGGNKTIGKEETAAREPRFLI